MEDIDLIKSLQEKKHHAFDILYKRFQPEIYSYCKKIIKNDIHDAAADIAINTFVKYLVRCDTFNSLTGIKSWLFRVARNECFSYLSKQRTRKKYIATLETEPSYEPHIEKENAMQINKIRDLMLHKINTFKNNQQKRVLNLYWLKDMPPNEVAAIMGVNTSAVYKHSCVAVKTLRKKMIMSLQ